jgi:adenosylcobinamide-GDP ribazoletransferase
MNIDKPQSSTTLQPTHLECFATAIQFLTRVPVTGAMGKDAEYYYAALRGAVLYFPIVGGLVGLFTAAVFLGASWVFSPWMCAFIAVGLEAMLTGAFHEDAFADTCDALGGGWTREQVLEIMKDSRLGTYGTLGLIVGVGARVVAIATLLPMGWLWTIASIVAASTLGRIAIIGMMATVSPIADQASQARDVSGTQTWKTLFLSVIISSPWWAAWFCMSPIVALATMTAIVVVLIWFRRKILVRVGGTTGDLLGCSAFLCQLMVLIGSTGIFRHG